MWFKTKQGVCTCQEKILYKKLNELSNLNFPLPPVQKSGLKHKGHGRFLIPHYLNKINFRAEMITMVTD